VSWLAAIASATYLVTLVVVPLLAPERDVLRSHPEHYADTTFGALVRVGYLAVAVMAWSVGVIAWTARARWRLPVAALALLGGAAAFVLALAPVEVTGGPLLVGILALALLPATASIASGGAHGSATRIFGIAVTLGFAAAVALAPREIAGLTNRVWDALLALWGVAFGLSTLLSR
jgi:hypothetical protein